MGYYTGFRFIGVVKEKYVKDIKKLNIDEDNCWKTFAKKHPFAKKYSENDRCLFIPFGVMSDNGNKLGCKDNFNNFQYPNYLEDGCTWNFACDLKNYDNTIEIFLNDIANEVCEKYIAFSWGEDELFPNIYRKEKENQDEKN